MAFCRSSYDLFTTLHVSHGVN